MENAKKEFETHAIQEGMPPIKCASIKFGDTWRDNCKQFYLPVGFSEAQMQSFLQLLDFQYDNGYGIQELSGHIWYTDGTFSQRGEYDGSEWWERMVCPDIPVELQGATHD